MTTKTPFATVVEQHGATVLRVCRAVIGPLDADDAWSETFLSALRAYPDLPPTANVEAWLVRIAHNRAIDLARKRSRTPIPSDTVPDRTSPYGEPEPPDDGLWEAVWALPMRQRLAVAYHYLGGLPYAEVADLVGGRPDAVRRAAADGIAALRRSYRPERDEREEHR